MQPTYIFDDFVADCAKGHPKAIVISKAIKTAPADFNLHTSAKVLEFIGNGGLERPHFINSKIWKNNPEPKIKLWWMLTIFILAVAMGTLHSLNQNLGYGTSSRLKKIVNQI